MPLTAQGLDAVLHQGQPAEAVQDILWTANAELGGTADNDHLTPFWCSVVTACGANLSQACNRIAKNMEIFGDVAHLNVSSLLRFQGNPISQSLAIRLSSSWLCKPSQHNLVVHHPLPQQQPHH